MTTKNTKQQKATKTANCEREHVEPKNEGSKATKSSKGEKACKNCK